MPAQGVESQTSGAAARLRLAVLRGFELTCEGEQVILPPSAQRLLALLAIHDRPLLRLYVAGTLWTEASEERSTANLRSALWRLRRSRLPLIHCFGEHIQLHPQLEVDLHQIEAVARAALRKGTGSPELEQLDLELLTADLLPDWYEDWVLLERERFRQLRLHALEVLCDHLVQQGRYALAVEAAVAAVQTEPLRESAQRALIAAHLAEGNRGEAIHQYRSYATLLAKELGLEPSSRMQELVRTAI
ncbi:MAG TPA: BTAD domain-containing putative transcriptional regulator [Candidatus Dormibacteraeota bacterium]|nr:BTAD domain-containing putative transcriptional regulator [Candidatus Dormibacteraeota bacterium]